VLATDDMSAPSRDNSLAIPHLYFMRLCTPLFLFHVQMLCLCIKEFHAAT